MMATPDTRPPLLPVTAEGIPASMRATPRWAPWRAVWNAKKQKYEKIPHRIDRIEHGLSNKSTNGWGPFYKALAVYLQNPDKFAGVGYLMTGPHGVTAIDIDHCVVDGEIAPWAAEVVAKLDSYTEISPSGTGLRVMISADIERDWTNHDRGIEVYGGNEARFVTITGAKVLGSPVETRAPRAGVMENLTARYRKSQTAAQVEDLHLPALLGADELPDIADLELPPHAKNFLLEGPEPGRDRSQALFATSIALSKSGLAREVIFSLLEANEHAMEIALDHRRQDYDKALRYLWKDHCKTGAARANDLAQLDLSQFEDETSEDERAAAQLERDMAELLGAPIGVNSEAPAVGVDDFEDLTAGDSPQAVVSRDLSPVKLPRFTPQRLDTFMSAAAPEWIIRDVVPRAGLAVVYGASGSGKTFLVLNMAGAIAQGADWRGHKVAKGRVVYVVAEGAGGFRKRVKAYCHENGLAPESVDILVIADVPNFLDKTDIKLLIEAIKKVGPVSVIVIDTYARVMAGGNENDAKDTGQAVAHCDALHRVFKALVILVHHSGKDATRGARGSGALRAAADLEIEVIQTRDYRAATVTKMKDAEDGAEYAFRLDEVTIGMDEEGFPITSCVVEHRDAMPKHQRKEEPKGDVEKAVYQYLTASADLSEGGMVKEDLIDGAADTLDFDPQSGKKDRRKEVVKRALESLQRKNLVTDDGFTVTIL